MNSHLRADLLCRSDFSRTFLPGRSSLQLGRAKPPPSDQHERVLNSYLRRLWPIHVYQRLIVAVFVVLIVSPVAAGDFELSGDVAIETRGFWQSPRLPSQSDANVSLALNPELYAAWDDGADSLLWVPFARLDQNDSRRSHVDIRELTYVHAARRWEVRVGVRRVFWGVAESNHLVDIVNQTDLIENIDTEDKLGQPMVNLALKRTWGTVDLFVLPGFRERSFAGREGRFQAPFPIDDDSPRYVSPAGNKHVDYALRYAHSWGRFDIGLAHFWGTSREPRLILAASPNRRPELRPNYDIIHQSSLDLQATVGSCAFKLEVLRRSGQGKTFAAAVGGFEYTLVGVFGSAFDLGLLSEFHYDERGDRAITPFNHDVFVGSRLAANDAADSQVLSGVVVDVQNGGEFFNVEASRRFGDHWRLELELRLLTNIARKDVFYGLRRDDYVQVELARLF